MNKFKLPSTRNEITAIEYINIYVEYLDENNNFNELITSITKHNQYDLMEILERNNVKGQVTNVRVIPIIKKFNEFMAGY